MTGCRRWRSGRSRRLPVSHSVGDGQAPQPDWLRWREKRGVVIAGRIKAEEGAALANWAERLGWPLLADIQSQTGQPLPCADLWLNSPRAQRLLTQAELVVQFGGNLVSKRLLQWQQQARPQQWWLIDPLPGRRDPASQPGGVSSAKSMSGYRRIRRATPPAGRRS